LRKLCTAVLFAFLATVVVAGAAAAAAPVVTRNHIDYLKVDATGIPHDIRPGYNIGLDQQIDVSPQNQQRIIRHVSKDNWHVFAKNGGKAFVYKDDPLGTPRELGFNSSDYQLMKLHSPDLRTFFNVPDRVIDMLYGGNGSFEGKKNKDVFGFTIHKDHAIQIVNKLALNPANGDHNRDGAVMVPYMFSVDLTAGQIQGKTTVLVPVGLNYEFFSGEAKRAAYDEKKSSGDPYEEAGVYFDVEAARSNVWNKYAAINDLYKVKDNDDGAKYVGYTSSFEFDVKTALDNTIFGNNRFTGMRARDINLVKVYGDATSGRQQHFELVSSKANLTHGKFVITKVQINLAPANDYSVTETVLQPDDVIKNDAPYRILFCVRDQEENWDFTSDLSKGAIIDPVLIYAEYPFVKDPNVKGDGSFQNTVEEVTLWGRIASMSGPGYVAYAPADAAVWSFPDTDHPHHDYTNDYTQLVRDTFDVTGPKKVGASADNMVWFKNSVITDQYGFDLENVHQFPMTMGELSARQNTGVIVFSIREPEKFVGRRVSDVRIINATGKDFASPQEYRFVDNRTDMVDGTFAVLQRDPAYPTGRTDDPFAQVMMHADDEFVEGQAYFIALAAKDGGDFDVQQGMQGVNDTKNDYIVHYAAFAVVGSATPVLPTLVIGPAQSTIEPGEELQLTATRSDTGDDVDVTWESSDDAVLTVEDGLVTGVADGTAVVTATPVAPSDLDPATKTITVQTPQPGGGGSGGGCSVGFAPAAVLLLAPLFVLLKK